MTHPSAPSVVDLGGPVSFRTAGPPDAPPLVLVHGLGGASENWLPVLPLLAGAGYRVLALDLVGHGRTPRADRAATMDAHLTLLDAFIRAEAGGSAILVGNSMGGLLAMMQAARMPATVRALVLVAPAVPRFAGAAGLAAARAFSPAIRGAGPTIMRARQQRYTPEEVVVQSLRLCARDIATIAPAVVEAHVALAVYRAGLHDAVPSFIESSSSMIRVLGGRRVDDTVRAVHVPTLILAGAHDRLVPLRALERVRALRRDWSMHVFEDCGHIPQMEDPHGFTEVVTHWLGSPSEHLTH